MWNYKCLRCGAYLDADEKCGCHNELVTFERDSCHNCAYIRKTSNGMYWCLLNKASPQRLELSDIDLKKDCFVNRQC